MFSFFLSSGLFLGWSLGANDAANVFGTAVGSRMIRFRTAAVLCSLFIIIGAVISGAGASETLGKLGAVNAVAGAFMVALAAALTVHLMTKAGYPVSTSQAIVGAILGWNLFSGSATDYHSLTKIVLTWVACPLLSALFAVMLYKLMAWLIKVLNIHMFRLDSLTRYGLILVGAFGSYSLGANNIANVMGVFIPAAPFQDISVMGLFTLTSAQQLFLLGGLAIATGVITYSRRVMMTVGTGIMELSPVAALVVVWAHSLVLFLFASQGLQDFLRGHGLPSLPLVPVSSSQAIVGAVIGVGMLKGGRAIRWRTVFNIAGSWVLTPLAAGLVSFVCLFFLQNVFQLQTYQPVAYQLTPPAMRHLQQEGFPVEALADLQGRRFASASSFLAALGKRMPSLEHGRRAPYLQAAELHEMRLEQKDLAVLAREGWPPGQIEALKTLVGRRFQHKWQLAQALARVSSAWRSKAGESKGNRRLGRRLSRLYQLMSRHAGPPAAQGR